jgi:hypothetical protein
MVSDIVKFPEKGLGTMAAIWPSMERVNGITGKHCIDFGHFLF